MPADVLVVGAGPTGLALTLQAHDHGASVRIVERRVGPRPSRALVVHPRTLECLRPLGVVADLAARADRDPRARLHLGSHEIPVGLGELALDDTEFGHPWLLRQQDVEDVLAAAVAARGIRVEYGTELVGLDPGGDGARATLEGPRGREDTAAHRVIGCDGAVGPVRGWAGIGGRERPYRQEIVLADVELETDLAAGVSHVSAGWAGVVFVFALGERASWRILVTRAPVEGGDDPGRADLQRLLTAAGLAGRVTEVAWSTRLRLTRRVATTYRRGPVLLVGDAALGHRSPGTDPAHLGLRAWLDRIGAHPRGDHRDDHAGHRPEAHHPR